MDSLILLLLPFLILVFLLLATSCLCYFLASRKFDEFHSKWEHVKALQEANREAGSRLSKFTPYLSYNNSEPFRQLDATFRNLYQRMKNSLQVTSRACVSLIILLRQPLHLYPSPVRNFKEFKKFDQGIKLLQRSINQVSSWDRLFTGLEETRLRFILIEDTTFQKLEYIQSYLIIGVQEDIQKMTDFKIKSLEQTRERLFQVQETIGLSINRAKLLPDISGNPNQAEVSRFRHELIEAYGAIKWTERECHEMRHFNHRLIRARNWSIVNLDYADKRLRSLEERVRVDVAIPLNLGNITHRLENLSLSLLAARTKLENGTFDDFQELSGKVWPSTEREVPHISKTVKELSNSQTIRPSSLIGNLVENIKDITTRLNLLEEAYSKAKQGIEDLASFIEMKTASYGEPRKLDHRLRCNQLQS